MKTAVSVLLLATCGWVATGQTVPITTLKFSPEGDSLLYNGDRSVIVHPLREGALEGVIRCDLAKVAVLTMSADATKLAVAGGTPGESGEVLLFSWPERRLLHRWDGYDDVVSAAAFDPAGKRLAIGCADAAVEMLAWEMEPPANPLGFVDHSGPVLAAAFSPDGETLLTAGADRSIKAWNLRTGKLLRTLSHHTEIVNSLSVRSQFGDSSIPFFCASGSDDRTVRVWQPEIGRMVRIVRNHHGAVLALAYDPKGERLFSAGTEGIIRIIDAHSDAIERQWNTGMDWIYALDVSPDGTWVAAGDWAGRVTLWETATGGTIEIMRRRESIPPPR